MVKHTQTIRPNCLSVFDHFMGLALKGLRVTTTACQISYWQSGLKQQKSPIFFFRRNGSTHSLLSSECCDCFFKKLIKIRVYSSCLMHTIVARVRLPFFKIFSNFLHFCPSFQMICPFVPFLCPFLQKSHACPYFLE